MRTVNGKPTSGTDDDVMTDDLAARGEGLKARRLALGIKSHREASEASGIDREAWSRAEKGEASVATYERAEAWLGRMEEEVGADDAPAPTPLRLTFHDVYGIGEIIVEGPVDRPEELTEAVSKLLDGIRRQQSRGQQ